LNIRKIREEFRRKLCVKWNRWSYSQSFVGERDVESDEDKMEEKEGVEQQEMGEMDSEDRIEGTEEGDGNKVGKNRKQNCSNFC
jgi:hypothetical protein